MLVADAEEKPNWLVGRDKSLAEVSVALGADRRGAVVVGPAGIGKSALIRRVAAGREFHLVTIRASRLTEKKPFGPLAWLICGLSEGAEAHPAQLLQELETLLQEQAGGKRILLLVDGAEHLDSLTAMVVSQLVRRSEACVLATVENLLGSPPEFLALWTDGLVRRIDLRPLELAQTRELMQNTLDAPVSSTAALAVQLRSGGNPHLSTLLTREAAAEGHLVHLGGAWVLAKPLGFSGQVAEVITSRLKQLQPAQRSLIQLLSLCDELPLAAVLQLVPSDAVDALEEEGAAEVSAAGMLRLTASMSPVAIAGSIAAGRSRELWEETAAILDPAMLGPAALSGFARWTLSCHGTLDPATALRAARLATAAGDPASALQYISAVPAGQRSKTMALEELLALSAAGNYHDALTVLKTLDDGDYTEDLDTWLVLQQHKTELLRMLPGHGTPKEALDKAATADWPGEANLAQQQRNAAVLLMRGALALDSGSLGDMPPELAAVGLDPVLSPETRARADALQAQYLALSGRAEQAMELVDTTLEKVGGTPHHCTVDSIHLRIYQALLAAGEYDRAHQLVSRLVAHGSRLSFRDNSGEVALAMAQALAGRSDRALDELAPTLQQLEMADPGDFLPTAQTLMAYVNLLQGDPAQALSRGSGITGHRCVPISQLQLQTSLLQVQVELAADPEQLCTELRSMARKRLDEGMVSPALDTLAVAVRYGDLDAARELAAAAASANGRWARALYCFGSGLVQQDAQLLVEAAQLAFALGNVLLANSAARSALRLLDVGQSALSRESTQSARRIEHLSFRELRDANTVHMLMKTLNPFEADLARRAAGKASRAEISGALNLSPRTIDWHLGKIFEKLHVSGRAELGEVLV